MNPDFSLTPQRGDRKQDVTIIRLQGILDAESAKEFEKAVESLLAQSKVRLLLDLRDLTYLSSAGIGTMIRLLHQVRTYPDGDIKACRVTRKIMKLFEAIGFSDVMQFFPDENSLGPWTAAPTVTESVNHFQVSTPAAEFFAGEPFPLRIEALDARNQRAADFKGAVRLKPSVGLISPDSLSGFVNGACEGPVTLSAGGSVTLSVSDGEHLGSLTLSVAVRPQQAQFPLTLDCQTCRTPITVSSPDLYRCETCDETFYVDEGAHVFPIKTGSLVRRKVARYKGVDLRINTDVNYLAGLRQWLMRLCEKEGMDEVLTNSVALAVEEILLNIIEHGHDFDPWQIMRLRLEFQKKQLKVQIKDYGEPYDITRHKDISLKSSLAKGLKRGVGGFLVNQLMDSVQYRTLKNYNQLTLIKRYGAPETPDAVS